MPGPLATLHPKPSKAGSPVCIPNFSSSVTLAQVVDHPVDVLLIAAPNASSRTANLSLQPWMAVHA